MRNQLVGVKTNLFDEIEDMHGCTAHKAKKEKKAVR
jgi:hypothetical protein